MPPMGLNPAGGMPGGIPRPYDIGGAAAAGPRGNIIPGAGPPTPQTGPVNRHRCRVTLRKRVIDVRLRQESSGL